MLKFEPPQGPAIANSLLSALEKASQWQRALAIFEGLKQPSLTSFGSLVSACAKGQEWAQAVKFLSLALQGRLPASAELCLPAVTGAARASAWQVTQELTETLMAQLKEAQTLQMLQNSLAMAHELAETRGEMKRAVPALPLIYGEKALS